MASHRQVSETKPTMDKLHVDPASIVPESGLSLPYRLVVNEESAEDGALYMDFDPPEPEHQPSRRVRGPAMETLADVRRQAKRLFLRFAGPGDHYISTENLRAAIALLALIKSTISEERIAAGCAPGRRPKRKTTHRQPVLAHRPAKPHKPHKPRKPALNRRRPARPMAAQAVPVPPSSEHHAPSAEM